MNGSGTAMLLRPSAADSTNSVLDKERMEQIGSNAIPSSSHSPAPLPAVEYEVFLSFRGPDVRKTLADFLHKFLNNKKIRTFLDNEALRKGEEIDGSLAKAIEESRIYIPIFSPGYASSKWCLKELALMVDHCKKDEVRHTILPIFYLMEPRDVRHCTGSYKTGIKRLRQTKKYDEETIKAWKKALNEVGQIKGWSVKESDGQGAVAEEVYSRVWPLVHEKFKLVTHELIGIDSHVNRVSELLNLGSGINIVGIHGIGGIGKTTIAKAVHDKLGTEFESRCFVENVRDIQSSETESEAINTLQSKIILSILGEDHKLRSGEGMAIIKDRVRSKKILIILDDVDKEFEFEKILGKVSEFSSESRFIITTRYTRVFELLGVSRLYELKRMSDDHSLQLFQSYAFQKDEPLEDRETLCKQFVEAAAGHPLTLQVIGSLLFRTSLEFWKGNLEKLKDMPHPDVQKRLKISYDMLELEEKEIFLDIACAFIGSNKEYPSYMWEDCKLYPGSGIQTLIWRSLIKLDENNGFWMHDHLRDMGRRIAREGEGQHCRKHTRIWSRKDAMDMLHNGEGADHVQVLLVSMEYKDFELTENAFQKFTKLRYLVVYNGKVPGDFKKILPNLRWLELYRCSSVPIGFNAENLVILMLRESNVIGDGGLGSWGGNKVINFPIRIQLPTHLSGCNHSSSAMGLDELLESLQGPPIMEPLDLSALKHLRELTMDGRHYMFTKVMGLDKLESLEKCEIGHCTFSEKLLDLSALKHLKILKIYGCFGLTELMGLGELESLGVLSIYDSWSIKKLSDLSALELLRELTIACLELTEITGLERLQSLGTCKSLYLGLARAEILKIN
ncbi:unnamed protein product [Linum tenue]|uniref:TIR domain-containing protein n=1 Tax=Linum tenue TaxID=586396 RepID=A0AAV0IB61_9ROSI|nr:unnamed protein product [Linum tenue]